MEQKTLVLNIKFDKQTSTMLMMNQGNLISPTTLFLNFLFKRRLLGRNWQQHRFHWLETGIFVDNWHLTTQLPSTQNFKFNEKQIKKHFFSFLFCSYLFLKDEWNWSFIWMILGVQIDDVIILAHFKELLKHRNESRLG